MNENTLYKLLVEDPSYSGQGYSTYAGKFCTYVGYNSATKPTQADLYLPGGTAPLSGKKPQQADIMSPILFADLVQLDNGGQAFKSEQAHQIEGVNAGSHDGSAQWIPFVAVESIKGVTGNAIYANRNPLQQLLVLGGG